MASNRVALAVGALVWVSSVASVAYAGGQESSPSSPAAVFETFPDPTGILSTFSTNGPLHNKGAFFQSLGTNGRSCSTCHVADQAFSLSPPKIRERFIETRGRDPLFTPVDGANCPNAHAGNPAEHSLLLGHGLIRVSEPLPADAQFTVSVVHDPYGCALVLDPKTGQTVVSEYRRPLPSANLQFLSAVMLDGRETIVPLTNAATFAANLQTDLEHQALSAIMGHAQANRPPTAAQLADIAHFESGLSTAQLWDRSAGRLDRHGASGGARKLASQRYHPGINDVLGADPSGASFNSSSMTAFAAWASSGYRDPDDESDALEPIAGGPELRSEQAEWWIDRAAARRDIAAGEKLFNTAPLIISAVRGLNDNPALKSPTSFKGTCTTCHDTPNVGNHSLPLPLDIGLGHSGRPGLEDDPNIANGLSELDAPDVPIYLINGCPNPFGGGQPVSFYTTDLGKGLLTGRCSDLNRVKGPILRGLAARAPYFHNGAAANLLQVVNFYNQRFQMDLTEEQKRQLVAFLGSL